MYSPSLEPTRGTRGLCFWLVEFYWYANANSAMWLAELLVYYQPLEYSDRSSTKCDVFIVFPKFWKEFYMQTGNYIPEKTKISTFTGSWLYKLENIEKAGTRVNNCKFAKDSSIRATFLKGKVQ